MWDSLVDLKCTDHFTVVGSLMASNIRDLGLGSRPTPVSSLLHER